MKINYGIAKFKIEKKLSFRDSEKMRGYIISIFKEKEEVHNHKKDGKSIYRFPNIQYKIINNNLSMVLFNEQIDFLIELYLKINKINIDGIDYKVEKNLEIKEYEIKFLNEEYKSYNFLTYYLPFNQENYNKFLNNEYSLEKAITNNLLEFLKGINLFLEKDQKIIVKDLKINNEKTIKIKNRNFLGYNVSFKTNLDLPDYISLGKRKSIGFGVLKNGCNS